MSVTEQLKSQQGSRGLQARHPEARLSICLESGSPLPALLVEVARNDLLFLTDRPLRFGTTVQLAIFCDLISAISYDKGTVHCCRATSHGWEIGLFLSQPLPPRLTTRVMDDIRGHLRYECDWKAWLLWDRDGNLDPVRIVNYSISGMRIKLNHLVGQGSEFLLFPSAGNRTEGAVHGKMQWCRQTDDGIVGGCLVLDHRGREIPRMFANLSAVHVSHQQFVTQLMSDDSPETQMLDLCKDDRFF